MMVEVQEMFKDAAGFGNAPMRIKITILRHLVLCGPVGCV
jgi:hypothetical protein